MENLYAFNKDGKLVEAEKSKKSDGDFFCPSCKGRMGVKKGKIKADHFFHISKECSSESYLHITAKTILYEKLKEHMENPKEIVFHFNNHYVNKNEECYTHINGEARINNNDERIDFLIEKYFLYFIRDDETPRLKELLKEFFSKVKQSKDKNLVNIFVLFHKWLINEIENYMSRNKRYLPSDFETIWINTKKKNSLIDNLMLVNQYVNTSYMHDYLSMKQYFERLLKEQKELIIKYCYVPTYVKTIKVERSSIDTSTLKDIYLDSKYHKGFLADILTFDKEDNAIFWEIAVTHKCEKTKIDSKVKIIEISVHDKDDLKTISDLNLGNLIIDGYNF